jgi:hypothetical protein
MSFQWIFDHAENLSITKRPVVSQTISRDQRIRAVSRGGNVWKFTVTLPTGMEWSSMRGYVEGWENAGLLKNQSVTISKAGHSWINGYRGDATSTSTMTFKYNAAQAASNTFKFELGNMPGATGTVLFRAGDVIQPTGSKYVYSIVSRVDKGTASTQLVEVHRSILDVPSDTAVTMKVGQQVTWDLMCTKMPTWTFISKDRIQFNGDFEFQEVL